MERKFSQGTYVVRRETYKSSSDYKTMEQKRKATQNREKQEWKNEKPKLDNARRLNGIYFVDRDDKE